MKETKRHILDVAMVLALEVGIAGITRIPLAKRAGVANGSVHYYFGSMEHLRESIVKEAIDTRNVKVLAKALGEGHKIARTAPEDLKTEAVATLI